MRRTILLFISFLFLNLVAFGQILEPVEWSWKAKHIKDNTFELVYKAKIDEGWSVYSQYLESDDGPIRTSFEYDDGGFELVGKNVESGGLEASFDQVFEMNVAKFKKEAIFTQKVEVSDYSQPITGYLTFMTCDDSRCLPPTDVDFSFTPEKPSGAGSTSSTDEPQAGPGSKQEDVAENTAAAKTKSAGDQGGSANKKNNQADNSSGVSAQKIESISASSANESQSGGFIDPVSWTIDIQKGDDDLYQLVFKGKIEEGWYVYSQNQESDDGPLATEFLYDESDNYTLKGVTAESGGLKKAYDEVFEMDVNKFTKEAVFTQKIAVSDSGQPITGYFTFQTCDNKRCKKYDIDFFADPEAGTAYLGEEAMQRTDAYKAGGSVAVGPQRQGNVINQEIGSIKTTLKDPVGECGGGGNEDDGWIWAFIFGFGGGLVALITPCVFPMIPLTVSFFTKGSNSRAAGIRNGTIYGLSIIAIYVSLGLAVTAIFGPEAMNQLSTHWLSNLIFFVVFIVFAISFFGYFELTLPSSLANKSDQMADKGGFLGIFFMAATLAIVSFSCTGPIVGTALVQTATNPVGPFFVMLGFSLALALPFGLFAAFPAWLNAMPRSGSWMTSVKVVLGFVELALALKFLSVADYTYHWGILKYELFMGLWVLIAAAMTLYLFGFIRFPHDNKNAKLSKTRWAFAFASLALTVYLATGFRYDDRIKSYAPPALMSGLAPPASYNFLLDGPQVDESLKSQYPSLTKCANDLDCFKDYYEGIAYAKEANLPVLLDFTGYGCVNCRKTEDFIWSEPPVRQNIDQNFVLISLYVDDPTKLDEILVSAQRNSKIRNIGNKWADFQIVNFEGNAQPLYVIMSADEKVLAYPRGYEEGWESYNAFLDCGLDTYRRYKQGTIGQK